MAPPIVSQAYIFLTKFYSYYILLTEKASDNVTAKGNPSGMATTRIAMEIKKYSRISFTYSIASSGHPSLLSTMINMITKTIKMARADTKPNIEISLANFSNFNYNGVNSSSLAIKSSIFPIAEFLPTFIMRILPVPVKTFVPANKTFDDIVWCLIVF